MVAVRPANIVACPERPRRCSRRCRRWCRRRCRRRCSRRCSRPHEAEPAEYHREHIADLEQLPDEGQRLPHDHGHAIGREEHRGGATTLAERLDGRPRRCEAWRRDERHAPSEAGRAKGSKASCLELHLRLGCDMGASASPAPFKRLALFLVYQGCDMVVQHLFELCVAQLACSAEQKVELPKTMFCYNFSM